jgi:hypothetical protein
VRYALSPYIKNIHFVFKGLMQHLCVWGPLLFEHKIRNRTMVSQTKALHYQIVMSVARRENTVSAVVIVHSLLQ